MIVKTLEEAPPDGDTHWSTRSMARASGHVPDRGLADLAGVRAQAAPGGDLEAVHRSAVHRQGPRHRRPLPRPARARRWCCAWTRSRQMQALDRTAPILPMMPGRAGPADPRLHPPRHHQPVRRPRHRHRQGDRPAPAPPPPPGVPAVPQDHRREHPRRAGPAPDPATTTPPTRPRAIKTLAGRPPALPPALHPDQRLLAQPRRTLVRRADQPQTPPLAPTAASPNSKPTSAPGSTTWNDDPKPFVWTKTADEILDNLASYCTRINQLNNDSGH